MNSVTDYLTLQQVFKVCEQKRGMCIFQLIDNVYWNAVHLWIKCLSTLAEWDHFERLLQQG